MATKIVHIERRGVLYSMTLDTQKDTLLATGAKTKYYVHVTKNGGEYHFYSTDVAWFDNKEYQEIKMSSKERILNEIANADPMSTTADYERFKPKEL